MWTIEDICGWALCIYSVVFGIWILILLVPWTFNWYINGIITGLQYFIQVGNKFKSMVWYEIPWCNMKTLMMKLRDTITPIWHSWPNFFSFIAVCRIFGNGLEGIYSMKVWLDWRRFYTELPPTRQLSKWTRENIRSNIE